MSYKCPTRGSTRLRRSSSCARSGTMPMADSRGRIRGRPMSGSSTDLSTPASSRTFHRRSYGTGPGSRWSKSASTGGASARTLANPISNDLMRSLHGRVRPGASHPALHRVTSPRVSWLSGLRCGMHQVLLSVSRLFHPLKQPTRPGDKSRSRAQSQTTRRVHCPPRRRQGPDHRRCGSARNTGSGPPDRNGASTNETFSDLSFSPRSCRHERGV